LVGVARRRGIRSSPLSGVELRERRLHYARILFWGLLRELPRDESARVDAQANMRAAYVTVMLKLIRDESGWDTAFVSYPWLACRLGLSPKSAERALRRLVENSRLTRPSAATGVVGRYSPREVNASWTDPIWTRYGESISALVDQRPDPLADLIATADHALWGYSDIFSHGNWLVLVADRAGIEAEQVGIRPAAARRLRADLLLHRFRTQRIDELAQDAAYGLTADGLRVSPKVAKQRAEAAYRENADATTERRQMFRDARDYLEEFIAENRLPALPANPGALDDAALDNAMMEFEAWASKLHERYIEDDLGNDFGLAMRAALRKQIGKARHPDAYAADVARFITGAPSGAQLNEFLLSSAI